MHELTLIVGDNYFIIVLIFALQLADDADRYLPLPEEEDTKNNGVANPINTTIALELDEIKESPSRTQQHAQTSV